ncbi:MAG: hypothetical protein GY765_19280 [bacterium]|nr:hypothetical protein [bacterium]
MKGIVLSAIFVLMAFNLLFPQKSNRTSDKMEIIKDEMFHFEMVKIPAGTLKVDA